MPLRDGTGPEGLGPRTGRGVGNCPPIKEDDPNWERHKKNAIEILWQALVNCEGINELKNIGINVAEMQQKLEDACLVPSENPMQDLPATTPETFNIDVQAIGQNAIDQDAINQNAVDITKIADEMEG